MGINWYVIYSQASKESVAERHLKDQGFTVYLPRFLKTHSHARKVEEKLVPLFPRYLFVKMNPLVIPWRSINGTRGVCHLLTTSEGFPCPLPDNAIEDLQAQESQKGHIPIAGLLSLAENQKIRVTEGAFKGQEGLFQTMDDRSRVRILLDFMGRTMKVILPSYTISPS